MSKAKKIVILVLLMIMTSSGFTMAQAAGRPQAAAFFSVATLGLLIAILVVGLSRRETRRG
jgi:hypothetical protein